MLYLNRIQLKMCPNKRRVLCELRELRRASLGTFILKATRKSIETVLIYRIFNNRNTNTLIVGITVIIPHKYPRRSPTFIGPIPSETSKMKFHKKHTLYDYYKRYLLRNQIKNAELSVVI